MAGPVEHKPGAKRGQRNRKPEQSRRQKPEQQPSPKADQQLDDRTQTDAAVCLTDVAPADAFVSTDAAPIDTAASTNTSSIGAIASADTFPIGFQTIATAYSDYTRKSFEQTRCFVEKLLGVRSLEKAIEIQTEFVKQACETFVADSQKIRELHRKLARQTLKPLEGLVARTTRAER
jgi:hypothetical protein